MKYQLFSIKDVLSGAFNEILIFQNVELAKRYFQNLCAESKIKNDLQLFRLGEYDVETGITSTATDFIMSGSEC